MKTAQIIVILILTSIPTFAGEKEKRINVKGVSKVEELIGDLGQPFGSIVNIEGRVKLDQPVEGHPRVIRHRYFIVTHINGRKQVKPIAFNLWSSSLPDSKDGDVVKATAYERWLMLGSPKELLSQKDKATHADLELRLYRYIHVLPDPTKTERSVPSVEDLP